MMHSEALALRLALLSIKTSKQVIDRLAIEIGRGPVRGHDQDTPTLLSICGAEVGIVDKLVNTLHHPLQMSRIVFAAVL